MEQMRSYIKCSVVSLVHHLVWKVTGVSLRSRVLADWLIQTHKRALFNRWTKHNMRILGGKSPLSSYKTTVIQQLNDENEM